MKFRTTLFFAALFFGILSLYLSQEKKEEKRVDQIKKTSSDFKLQVEEKSFEISKKEKIDFIQVEGASKENSFGLEKRGTIWHLSYPVQDLADQSLAQGMDVMIRMAAKQALLKPESDWAEYGLDHPSLKVGVKTNSGESIHFIRFGKEAPLRGKIFARWDDKKAYFLLPTAMRDAFRRTVYEMREKRLFRTPITKIDRIYIEIGGHTFDWTLKNGIWYWMEPLDLLGQSVKQESITAIIQLLSRLRIKEFLDKEKQDAYAAGVSMISDRIQMYEGNQLESIYFGKEETRKTAYYAYREGEEKLFLIDQTKLIEVLEFLNALDQEFHPVSQASAVSADALILAK